MAKDILAIEEKFSKKLDIIIEHLQTLIILQAAGMKISKHNIRKLTKTDMNRITEATSFIKKEKLPDEKRIKK